MRNILNGSCSLIWPYEGVVIQKKSRRIFTQLKILNRFYEFPYNDGAFYES